MHQFKYNIIAKTLLQYSDYLSTLFSSFIY